MNKKASENFGGVQKFDMATSTDGIASVSNASMTASNASSSVRERSLFIGGMSGAITERDLCNHFGQYGLIVKVYMKFDFITGMSRDYAFILFSEEEAVKRAIANGEHMIKGRKLSARRAKCRNNRIFVSGLPWSASEEEIMRYFSRFGDITDFQVPYDWQRAHRKSYCFISFISDQAVLDLLSVESHVLRGKTLVIKRATPRTDRPVRAPNGSLQNNNNIHSGLQPGRSMQSYALNSQQLTAYTGYNSSNNNTNTVMQPTMHTTANNNNNNANAAAGDSSSVNGYANAAINNTMGFHYMPFQQAAAGNGSGDSFAQYPYGSAGSVGWQLNQPLATTGPNAYGSVFANNFVPTNDTLLLNNVAVPGCSNFTAGGAVNFGGFGFPANAGTVDTILGAAGNYDHANGSNNGNNAWEILDLNNGSVYAADNPNQSLSNSSGFYEGNSYISNISANNNSSSSNNNITNNSNNNAENTIEGIGLNNNF